MSITWNGVSSDTIGVIVEKIPNRYIPTRRFSPQQIAGKNGNFLMVDKSFPNVEQEYEVYLSAESQGLPSVARACAEWLMGPTGYCRLTDSYDTTVYREAFLMGGFDLENILNKFGRCTITFSCKPQKYLLTGETPVTIPAGHTDTYTGDLVSFNGIQGSEISSLSVDVSPTQDLHGYANPWPGGGGKNKIDKSAGLISSSRYMAFGVESFSDTIPDGSLTLPAGDYTFSLSGDNSTNAESMAVFGADGTRIKIVYNNKILSFTNPAEQALKLLIAISSGNFTTWDNYDMQLEAGSAPTAWVPYANICPISGRTGLSVYISPTQDVADATTYSVDWTSTAGTVYGGTLDVVTGQLMVTMTNIASYNGETIGEPWVSSMDAYASGTTPTTGAQVVYTLATPQTYQLTPEQIEVLVGSNYIWSNAGSLSVTVASPLGGTITNPTPFEARPLLTVSGEGELTVNGKSILILEAVSDFKIDCETMEADDNSKIYCMDFPELSGGANAVIGSGTITALSIVPRWWTL